MSSDTPVCRVCGDLRCSMMDSRDVARSYNCSLGELHTQAGKGCAGCAVLRDGFEHFKHLWPHAESPYVLLDWVSPSGQNLLEIKVTDPEQQSRGYEPEIFFFMLSAEFESPWSAIKYVPQRTVLQKPDSLPGLEKIQSWITECVNDHRRCKLIPARLPKRVVDVGQLNNTNVSLYQTQKEFGSYIALSHCWGPADIQPLRTLSTNIMEMKTCIPWTELSKTFQDAIWLTQSLGIKYLWIDSLCIVQDDEVDWKEQSGEMCGVYGGSYLTVAATRSSNGNEGCFNAPADQHEIRPGVLVRRKYNHWMWIETDKYGPHKETNPLIHRGWWLQERLLSTRVLHYAAHEMSFECNAGISCECKSDMKAMPAFKQEFYEEGLWRTVVVNYSTTDLTRYTDYLEALSGTAKYYAARNKKTYLAGLWLEELPETLLWSSSAGCHRPPSYTAPSFSWASRIGAIEDTGHTCDDPKKYCLSIIHGECVRDTLNPYGAVSSGHLKVMGILLPSLMQSISIADGEDSTEVAICIDEIPELHNKEKDMDGLFHQGLSHDPGVRTLDVYLDTEEDHPIDNTPQRVYCVFVVSYLQSRRDIWSIKHQNSSVRPDWAFCLVLVRNNDGTYRRVGLAGFEGYLNWDDIMQKAEFTIV